MKILITQPTFLPWIGYFDLISDADVVVFLNDVQFEKRSWQQRNKIVTNNGLEWITIPVKVKGKRSQLIKDVQINKEEVNFNKIKKKIIQNYSNSKYFANYEKEFFDIFKEKLNQSNLIELNLSLILWVMKILKIKKKIYLSSDFSSKNKSTKKIIDICKTLNSKDYLSTIGSKSYLEKDIEILKKIDLNIFFHNYKHPKYRQCFKFFFEYASVIDLIFNEGLNSFKIIKSGNLKYTKLKI
tara:strand:+ start:7844 stop:8566 length:723 start_codon:yes stop_codon:yes gene_type:complete